MCYSLLSEYNNHFLCKKEYSRMIEENSEILFIKNNYLNQSIGVL
jgi:hypothetical protein